MVNARMPTCQILNVNISRMWRTIRIWATSCRCLVYMWANCFIIFFFFVSLAFRSLRDYSIIVALFLLITFGAQRKSWKWLRLFVVALPLLLRFLLICMETNKCCYVAVRSPTLTHPVKKKTLFCFLQKRFFFLFLFNIFHFFFVFHKYFIGNLIFRLCIYILYGFLSIDIRLFVPWNLEINTIWSFIFFLITSCSAKFHF